MQILIADDDRLTRRILEDNCSQWGYETIAVSDGETAWNVFNSENPPRIFLLDWVMPRLTGVELCQRIRRFEKDKYTYIILLTALNEPEHIVEGLEAGADDYITKPFHAAELHLRLNIGRRIIELEDRVFAMANFDYLTGVCSRRYLFQQLEHEITRCTRENKPLGLIMIDIDDFKLVNDLYGHLVGDQVLHRVGEIIKKNCRRYDLVGRFGGDEFIICLPGAGDEETMKIACRIRSYIEKEVFTVEGHTFNITISTGIASGFDMTHDELMHLADEGLYRAKSAGKNTCCSGTGLQIIDLYQGKNTDDHRLDTSYK